MAKLTYNEWKELVPDSTRKFFVRFAKYYQDDNYILDGEKYNTFEENVFIKMINAYYDLSEINRTYIKKYSNHKVIVDHYPHDIDGDRAAKYFSSTYDYFGIYKEKYKYKILTDDDIFLHMLDKLKNSTNSTKHAFDYDGLIKEISENNEENKKCEQAKIDKENYEGKDINQIIYMEMAGKIFGYLSDKEDKITIIDPTSNNLKAISLLASYFLYNQVDSENYYNTKDIILECFEAMNFTLETLEKIVGVKFDLDKINEYDPTLIVDYYFLTEDFKYSYLVDSPNYQLALQKILSEANLGVDFLKNKKSMVKLNSNTKSIDVDDYFKYISYELKDDLDFLLKTSVYLTGKDISLVEYYDDIVELSIILLVLSKDCYLKSYLNDMGLDINKLSELIDVELDLNKINEVEVNKNQEYKFKKYLYTYFNNIKVEASDVNFDTIKDFLFSEYKTTAFSRVCSLCKIKDIDYDTAYNYLINKEKNRVKEVENQLFMGLSDSTINFIKSLSKNYPTSNVTNKELIAALKSVYNIEYNGNNSDLKSYIYSLHIPTLSKYDYLDKYDIDLIKEKFSYIFELKNINIYTILEEIYKRAEDDYFFEKIDKNNKDSFLDIEEKVKLYKKEEEETNKRIQYNLIVPTMSNEAISIFDYAIKVYKYLLKYKDKFNLTDYQRKDLSIIIATLKTENKTKQYFINNNFTLTLFNDIDFKELESINVDHYEAYIFEDYVGYGITIEGENAKYKNILYKNLFSYDSIIKKICLDNNIKYDYLEYEVTYQKNRELTDEEKFEKFANLKVPSISVDSISEVAGYGNDLSTYTNYINTNYSKLSQEDSMDNAINEINSLLDNIYEKEENTSIFAKLFKNNEPKIKNLNSDVVQNITTSISENIKTLYSELKGYDAIRKYIEVYIIKLEGYIKNIDEVDKKIDEKLSTIDKDSDYIKFMELSSLSQIIKNKKRTFETSLVMMKQELTKIHQMIVSHFITINSLTTAKDDILPLIVSETAINIGKKSEMQALEVSNNLVDLLQNVLNKNVEASLENLEYLKNAQLPVGVYDKMSSDINLYLQDVKQEEISIENPITKELKK